MRESIWGYAIISLGIIAIGVIWFFVNVTRTDQHNYNLLKETVEASMLDALDLSAYREDGTIKISEEKFVESFLKRFANNVDNTRTYNVKFYDINEVPPKVSVKVDSLTVLSFDGKAANIETKVDSIIEANNLGSTQAKQHLEGVI